MALKTRYETLGLEKPWEQLELPASLQERLGALEEESSQLAGAIRQGTVTIPRQVAGFRKLVGGNHLTIALQPPVGHQQGITTGGAVQVANLRPQETKQVSIIEG